MVNHAATCELESQWFELEFGIFNHGYPGTECNCRHSSDGNGNGGKNRPGATDADADIDTTTADDAGIIYDGVRLSCRDTECISCNRNMSVCSINERLEIEYHDDSTLWSKWKATLQYVVGRDETITFEYYQYLNYTWSCNVELNGIQCNSCNDDVCADGHRGFSVDCENVVLNGESQYSANLRYDLCGVKEEDFIGPLAVFTMFDPQHREGCAPRIYGASSGE